MKHNGEVGNLPGGGWGVLFGDDPEAVLERRPPPSISMPIHGFACCQACSAATRPADRCKPGVDLTTLTMQELLSPTCNACIRDRQDEWDRRGRERRLGSNTYGNINPRRRGLRFWRSHR